MSSYVLYEENTEGRDFIVGDIHGCFDVLDMIIEKVKLDPDRDRLFLIGDLIDRGPHSFRCLEYLDRPYVHAIRGNHEDLFLEYCDNGETDLKKLFSAVINNGAGWVVDMPETFLKRAHKAFSDLPIVIEIMTATGNVGLVHADVPKGQSWQHFIEDIVQGDNVAIEEAIEGRHRVFDNDDSGVSGIDLVFLGHTPQTDGHKILGNCVYIDTGAVFRHLNKGYPFSKLSLTAIDASASIDEIKSFKPKVHPFQIIESPQL